MGVMPRESSMSSTFLSLKLEQRQLGAKSVVYICWDGRCATLQFSYCATWIDSVTRLGLMSEQNMYVTIYVRGATISMLPYSDTFIYKETSHQVHG